MLQAGKQGQGRGVKEGQEQTGKNSTLMMNVLESIGWGKEGGGGGGKDEQTAEWLTSSPVLQALWNSVSQH